MNRILHGDNMVVLPTLAADSIDACVTDPPYGIGFMGKEWDMFKPETIAAKIISNSRKNSKPAGNASGRGVTSPSAVPSEAAGGAYDRTISGQRGFQQWVENWSREVMRVLKPGGHFLVCGAPRSFHRLTSGIEDAGFEIRDCIMWVFGQGYPKSHNLHDEWEGWGTALKPAWEPIIVARKPFPGTVEENMRAHGVSAINISGCRVDGVVNSNPLVRNAQWFQSDGLIQGETGKGAASVGRWPANLIHDGSDEVVRLFTAEAGAFAPVTRRGSNKFANTYGAFAGQQECGSTFQGDSGSAARFFYCTKTSRVDRNEGCESLDKKPLNWSSGTQSPGTFQSEGTDKTSQNSHPTVKPTSLMRYLVRLVTPPGGVVLDPFGGSGSTAKACIYEGLNYVLIEREAEYVEIIKARCAWAEQDHRDNTAQQALAL